MTKKSFLLVMIFFSAVTLSLSAQWADGGNDDGQYDGDYQHSGYPMTAAQQQQLLAQYPGIKSFIDSKTSAGATILGVELDWAWGTQRGEVAVSESNSVTVYYINPQSGAVLQQFNAPGWGW